LCWVLYHFNRPWLHFNKYYLIILLSYLIATFAVSCTVLEKFDVKQSNDLEISPRSSTVASRESCRMAMYVKCSEDSERKKRKSPFQRPHSHLTPPPEGTPANICINLILPETTFPGLHFCRWQYMGSCANFRTVLSENWRRHTISYQARNRFYRKIATQGHLFRYHWRNTKGLHSTI